MTSLPQCSRPLKPVGLSVQVPAGVYDRIRALAAFRGQLLGQCVRELIEFALPAAEAAEENQP